MNGAVNKVRMSHEGRSADGIDDTEPGQSRASYKRRRTALACKSCRTRKTRVGTQSQSNDHVFG